MIALAVICLGLLAYIACRELAHSRQRRDDAALLARSRAETAAERDRAAKERKELYQRIQAPEIAVAEHVRASRPDRPKARPIAADDDKRFKAERDSDG